MTARLIAAIVILPIAALAQSRDATQPAAATGTGLIAGVVVTTDANPQPLRRAVVTISGDLARPRSAITDDSGAFAFRSLPAGSFAVTARKAAYLAAPYGAKRPGRAGTPIALAAGQQATISIAMFRGAAVAGVLRDSAGLPIAGVDVRAIDARVINAPPDGSLPDLATTDDRGAFRIYGLLPGDYVIAALPSVMGPEIGAPTAAELDRTIAALDARSRLAGAASPPAGSAPAPAPRPTGYAPVYFPGTSDAQQAARVTVAVGEEREGIDFVVRPLPFAAIEGIVSGDVPNLTSVQVTLIPSGPRVVTSYSSSSLVGKAIDAEGRFRYANLAPGRYRVAARARRDPAAPAPAGGARGGGGTAIGPIAGVTQPAPGGDALFAVADVDLQGEDVTSMSLVLQPGAALAGRIVFNGAAQKPSDLTKTRLFLSLEGGGWSVSQDNLFMGPSFLGSAVASVRADGTFDIRGIGPGRYTLACILPPESKGWSLRSALAADRDLLDDVIDTAPGMEIHDVVIMFSDAPPEISGTLQSASGQPTAAYDIVALPADRALWRPKARRILTTRPSTSGRFVLSNVPAGSYLIAALNDLDPLDLLDATFLEQIAASGLAVTVKEGEKKVQDLRIK
jgi:hypothetical protein